MFRKLRIQFIAVVMASVAIVLAIVFTGICAVEYQRSASDVDQALTSAIERAAEEAQRMDDHFGFGMMRSTVVDDLFGAGDSQGASDTQSAEGEGAVADGEAYGPSDQDAGGPRIGGRDRDQRSMVPVAVYSLTETNSFILASRFTTASIDSDVLQAAAETICELDDGAGTIGDLGLHYRKTTLDGTTYVAFADASTTDSWKTLALMLVVAGLGMLVVFFFVSLALSKWALKPVREAWDAQRQFVADASHDLKTPLTVILANASILLKHPERSIASQSQWIESTQVEAQHMQGLVNEMLELAQVEAGQTVASAPFEQLDFSDLVDGETLMFDSVALEQNCQFDCTLQTGITVSGNPQQLHKMVSTLVENAFKYVDARGTVRVSLTAKGKNACLTVRNSGSVISPEDLPHIFDRFYRTDKARTSGAGGFGLGLAIAREIARSHGGDITCTSSAAEGTVFTVLVPRV